jgi:predicted tellurium resistance membrane protein TerC
MSKVCTARLKIKAIVTGITYAIVLVIWMLLAAVMLVGITTVYMFMSLIFGDKDD